jgi:hypothetical protein
LDFGLLIIDFMKENKGLVNGEYIGAFIARIMVGEDKSLNWGQI